MALIGERLWKRKLAGDPSILGGALTVNDVPLTIVGILPEGFAGLSGKAEIWIAPPMAARLYYSEYLTTPQNFISAVARLKDGVSLSQANAELAAIGPRFIGNGSAPDIVWGARRCRCARRASIRSCGSRRSCCSRPRRACC